LIGNIVIFKHKDNAFEIGKTEKSYNSRASIQRDSEKEHNYQQQTSSWSENDY